MEAREELLNIAEIAIGIAGFSGVIAAFLQRDGLHPLDRVRFVNLFATAFSTLALAYVPIVVSHLLDGNGEIWRYSSAVMIVFWFMNSLFGLLFVFPELRKDTVNTAKYPSVLLLIPSFLNLGTQCFNVGGWFWDPGFVPYLFGLFVYLYAAGLMFVYVILFRPAEPAV